MSYIYALYVLYLNMNYIIKYYVDIGFSQKNIILAKA